MSESAFARSPVVYWVTWDSYPALQRALDVERFHVLVIDGSDITDPATLFSQIARDLPEDPADVRSSWDALNDSLWGGLVSLEESRIAILWLHADFLLASDAETLYTALDVFRQVAEDLHQPTHEAASPVELRLFLLGSGSSFKPFPTQPPSRALH